jgi:hypothetical protein
LVSNLRWNGIKRQILESNAGMCNRSISTTMYNIRNKIHTWANNTTPFIMQKLRLPWTKETTSILQYTFFTPLEYCTNSSRVWVYISQLTHYAWACNLHSYFSQRHLSEYQTIKERIFFIELSRHIFQTDLRNISPPCILSVEYKCGIFLPLCCLFFLDLRILIIPLVSSNLS